MNPLISMLVPTRRRPTYLQRMAGSLVETLSQKSNLELLLAFDNDDTDTRMAWENMPEAQILQWKCLVMPRKGYAGMHIYTNALAEIATGKWLWRNDDDIFVKTKGWDVIVLKQKCDKVINCQNLSDREYSRRVFMHPLWPRDWFLATGRVSTHQQTDTYIDLLAKTHGRYSLEWLFDIVHVFEGATPQDRLNDEVTREISYRSDYNMDDIKRDAEIIKNLP